MKKKGVIALALAVLLPLGSISVPVSAGESSAIDPVQFELPDQEYRPGVRWWWPGGAVDADGLEEQLAYLADNMFGSVEINPFGVEDDVYPDAQLDNIENDVFYDNIQYAVNSARDKGLHVDLNMGSGWNANSIAVEAGEAMGNMALGRSEAFEVTAEEVGQALELDIPAVQMSNFYEDGRSWTGATMNWIDESVVLQGALIGRTEDNSDSSYDLSTAARVIDPATEKHRSFDKQTVFDPDNTVYIDITGDTRKVQFTPAEAGTYEIVGLYYASSGQTAVDNRTGAYVVDHLDSGLVKKYMDEWIGSTRLKSVISSSGGTVRSVFNDSYEFYTDVYYNEILYANAKDAEHNVLGYDFTRYLPLQYKIGGAAPFFATMGQTSGTFLTWFVSDEENSRITYDYNQLVNELFLEGMAQFQASSAEYGVTYRQQAYNPPIDTIGTAEYNDIPETEQANEWSMKRVSSGAHLYGKNVVTAEQYTLGTTPMNNTLEQVKNGYDLMATSGVNNFFYHGLSYNYYGTEAARAVNYYGEDGWEAMQSIGINVDAENPLSKYFKQMNTYAARANYVMQQGYASMDTAVYMPTFASLSETDTVRALHANGYTWDAINDASIQERICYQNGRIVVREENVETTYGAIIVDSDTVPVATMKALQELAGQGAVILFVTTPVKQPSWCDGAYSEYDAEVAQTARQMLQLPTVSEVSADRISSTLAGSVSIPITYEYNENVRFARRALSTGGELAYIRNIGSSTYTIKIQVDSGLTNCYWLDQNTGKIYNAVKDADGSITLTLGNSNDALGTHYSQAVILLCEPAGVEIPDQAVSAGMGIHQDTAMESARILLDNFTLTVTADNIGTNIPADMQTKTYTGSVLGDWSADGFLNNELRYVAGDGIYKTTWKINDLSEYNDKRVQIDLGDAVYTAAEVIINGSAQGQITHAPYKLDITGALKQGENEIEIVVTTRKYNRYVGFGEASRAGSSFYDYHNSFSALTNTGLASDSVDIVVYDNVGQPEVTAAAEDKKIVLDWKAVDGAAGYNVYLAEGDAYTRISRNLAEENLTVEQLVNGEEYTFAVAAVHEDGWESLYSLISAVPAAEDIEEPGDGEKPGGEDPGAEKPGDEEPDGETPGDKDKWEPVRSDSSAGTSSRKKTPQTGDDRSVILYAALLAITAAGGTVLTYRKKQQNQT